jgi:hypothetical protein
LRKLFYKTFLKLYLFKKKSIGPRRGGDNSSPKVLEFLKNCNYPSIKNSCFKKSS